MNDALIASFVSELIKISQQQGGSWGEVVEPVRSMAGKQRIRLLYHDRRNVRIPAKPTTPPVAQRTAPAPAPKINFARPGAPKFQPIGGAGGRPQVAPNLQAKGMTGQAPRSKPQAAPKFDAAAFQKAMGSVKAAPAMQNAMKPIQ